MELFFLKTKPILGTFPAPAVTDVVEDPFLL